MSVEQVLQTVTDSTGSTEDLHEDYNYSMVGPEKMEEHSISDSEEEPGMSRLNLICGNRSR